MTTIRSREGVGGSIISFSLSLHSPYSPPLPFHLISSHLSLSHTLTHSYTHIRTHTLILTVIFDRPQALMKQWEKYVQKTKTEKESIPTFDKVLLSSELVLDNHGQLQEINRLAGENEVR